MVWDGDLGIENCEDSFTWIQGHGFCACGCGRRDGSETLDNTVKPRVFSAYGFGLGLYIIGFEIGLNPNTESNNFDPSPDDRVPDRTPTALALFKKTLAKKTSALDSPDICTFTAPSN